MPWDWAVLYTHLYTLRPGGTGSLTDFQIGMWDCIPRKGPRSDIWLKKMVKLTSIQRDQAQKVLGETYVVIPHAMTWNFN